MRLLWSRPIVHYRLRHKNWNENNYNHNEYNDEKRLIKKPRSLFKEKKINDNNSKYNHIVIFVGDNKFGNTNNYYNCTEVIALS